MTRPVLTTGTIPARDTLEGELFWLRADVDAARRTLDEFGGHGAAVSLALAKEKVQRFLDRHPEVAS